MKPKEFELRVIKAVKANRIFKNQKQLNVAEALGMTDSNYCKIERGEKAITIEQLRIAANFLKTNYLHILFVAKKEVKKKLI